MWNIKDQKDTFDGAPIGLQVTGKRFEEEKAPGLREAVTTALQDFQDFEPNLA